MKYFLKQCGLVLVWAFAGSLPINFERIDQCAQYNVDVRTCNIGGRLIIYGPIGTMGVGFTSHFCTIV
ncbi:Uncharacterised protein [Weissella viridescens]|uniref:Uncharacterized protein n=1 Tax=Weissella viridescens TaxID=1629 RepID=A0A380NYI8_WEIVI|nr:Uncharacterised protein [Weissella viridescens]